MMNKGTIPVRNPMTCRLPGINRSKMVFLVASSSSWISNPVLLAFSSVLIMASFCLTCVFRFWCSPLTRQRVLLIYAVISKYMPPDTGKKKTGRNNILTV
jgi:hypothetical protein